MKTGRNLIQIWLLCAVLLTAFIAYGQGNLIYDQQSSTTPGAHGDGAGITDDQPMGQSFIPTLPAVGFVQLEFEDFPANGLGTTVFVNLWSGSISNGTLLGSTAPVYIQDGVVFAVTTFYFSTPVPVTPGTTYYIQPYALTGDINGIDVILSQVFNYTNGTAYFRGAPNPNNQNFWFREGTNTVIPPGVPNTTREFHTAALLPNGKVLFTGGFGSGGVTNSAELYDPATTQWTNTGALHTAREYHTATMLPNGKVLVAGGYDGSAALSSAELYDPISGIWTKTGILNFARAHHTATLLTNGQVLVVGGTGSGNVPHAELYDPSTGMWTVTGALNIPRAHHTATLLTNGQVLVVGGLGNGGVTNGAELFNPAAGTWTKTGSLNTGREYHTATLLTNGLVLVAGGVEQNSNNLTSAELYNPASGTWTITTTMATARNTHSATLLPNGQVLVVGGIGDSGYLSSEELFTPSSQKWTTANSVLNTAAQITRRRCWRAVQC